MSGINRYFLGNTFGSRSAAISAGVKCVFISHQRADHTAAQTIADALIKAGISVYFDAYEADLKYHHQNKNPKEVTSLICKGINNSSHMLVVASPTTIFSTWVPFEIGYGFDKTDLSVICLKGIPKGGLPDYIRSAKIVRDIYDFNNYISTYSGVSKETLLETRLMSDFGNSSNPLSNIMDSLINDQY